MNLLHRHILWNVLAACAAAVGLFAFVLILGNVLKDLMSYALAGQLSPTVLVTLLLLLVPYVCAYALPMGILTGVLLVLGRMSAQHEITAMRAAGLSLGFIARPVMILALGATVVAWGVNFYYMPMARTAYKQILADSVRQNPLSFIVPKTFIREFPGVVLYVGEKDGVELRDFWLWQLDGQNRVVNELHALAGRFDYDEAANTLVLTLSGVSGETRDADDPENYSLPPTTLASEQAPLEIDLGRVFGRETPRTKLSWQTFDQLMEKRRSLTGPGQEAERMQVSIALHEKASTAVAVFAFALLAVPLGVKVSRQETSANLGVALGLVMAYYFLTVVAGWLDQRPELRPDLLLWVPSLLFLGLGGWLFHRSGKV